MAMLVCSSSSWLRGAEFTIRLVKSDRPGELVHVLDEETAKWRAEGKEGFPPGKHSDFDTALRIESGQRVVTWVKHLSVDGKRIFQKRYKGKYLFREAAAEVSLGDGPHVMKPGEHVFTVKDGKASSPDPDIQIDGTTVSLTCYPVTFHGINRSVDPSEHFIERATHLPGPSPKAGAVFNVQTHDEAALKKDARDARPKRPASPWVDLLEIHTDYKPLIVYLPANTQKQAYRITPSRAEFTLTEGQVVLRPVVAPEPSPHPSGVRVLGDATVWIPRVTSSAVFRFKTSQPLYASLSKIFEFDGARETGRRASPTFEHKLYYHQFYEPRTREFNAGLPGRPPGKGLEVSHDTIAFPHRVLLADNRYPQSNESRLLVAALKTNISRVGTPLVARVQFRDLPELDTLGGGEIKAFVSADPGDASGWKLATVTKTDEPGLYHLSFPAELSGVYTLRVSVDRPGVRDPQSGLYADFQLGLEQEMGKSSSVSVFTHYNREVFYEGEGIDFVTVVRNEAPLSGTLGVKLAGETEAAIPLLARELKELAPGRHTFNLRVPEAVTLKLRPGKYRLAGSLGDCKVYDTSVRIVGRTAASPQTLALHAAWGLSPYDELKKKEHITTFLDNLLDMGLNQLIDSPLRALKTDPVPLQERVFTAQSYGLPAEGRAYQPSPFQMFLDETLSRNMTLWTWDGAQRICLNLRWGPFEDLDIDRRRCQVLAQLGDRYEHVLGVDFGYFFGYEPNTEGGTHPGAYPEQTKQRNEVLLPRRYQETYGLKCPNKDEFVNHFADGKPLEAMYDRWRKFMELRCELFPEVLDKYREAVRDVDPDLLTTVTQGIWPVASFQKNCVYPETFFRRSPAIRWLNYHDIGTRPLDMAFVSALSRYKDDDTLVSVGNEQMVWFGPRWRRDHFRLWRRGLMARACGANDITYDWTTAFQPPRRMGKITAYGFTGRGHVLERVAENSLHRALKMYGGIFDHAKRERSVAILHSKTQQAFEHVYFADEYQSEGVDKYGKYLNAPYNRGRHARGLQGAFAALLRSHLPADIVDEAAATDGRLNRYKGLIIAGVEVPLPDEVKNGIVKFVNKGGVVIADRFYKADLPGAIKLDYHLELLSTSYGNKYEHRNMQSNYLKIQKPLNELIGGKFKRTADCPDPTVFLSTMEWRDSRFLVAAGDRIPTDEAFSGMHEREPVSATVTIEGPRPVIYDLFEMKKVEATATGNACTFTADLTRVGAKLFAILPQDLSAPTLQVSESATGGQRVSVVAAVPPQGDSQAELLVPVEVTVLQPNGKIRYRVYRTAKGKAGFREAFKIASNDPAGEWRVRVRELCGGRAAEAAFSVAAAEPLLAPPLPAEDVLVFDAEKIKRFLSAVKEVTVPYDPGEVLGASAEELSLARLAAGELRGLGMKATVKETDEFATLRRQIPRKEPNRAERQVGAKYLGRGSVVIACIGGRHALVKSLMDVGVLPVRLNVDFPGPGRGVIMHVVSPFYFGHDALIVSGGDTDGVKKALAALKTPSSLRDWGSGPPAELPVSTAALKAGAPVAQDQLGSVPKAAIDGLDGLPVTHLVVSKDGSRILAATESFMKNVFMLDAAGKVLWSGKGARKWVRECWVTGKDEALVADAWGALYHLDSAGKTVRRFEKLGHVSASSDGEAILAANSDLTLSLRPDGSVLWKEDYFAKRKDYAALKSRKMHDDITAVSPDGLVGVLIDWQRKTEGKRVRVWRRMRVLDMKTARPAYQPYNFESRESLHDKYNAGNNMAVRFSPTSALFAVVNDTGTIFFFDKRGMPRGRYFEGQPATSDQPELVGTRQGANWRLNNWVQFVEFNPAGSLVLAGFTNRKVVLMNTAGRVSTTLRFEGTVIYGAFLAKGFMVYADRHLHGYDDAGKELWKKPLPVIYTMTRAHDGDSMICGSTGGHVYRVAADGTIAWQTDLHPAGLGTVDELFRDLAAAKEVRPLGSESKGELESLRENVAFSPNVLSADRWTGESYSAAAGLPKGEMGLDLKNGFAEQTLEEGLVPFATYLLVARWQAHANTDVLHLKGTCRDAKGEPIITERAVPPVMGDWTDAVLPIKTGPTPGSVTVRLEARSAGTVRLRQVGLHRAAFASTNLALVPSGFGGITAAVKRAAQPQQKVMLAHVVPDMGITLEPLEMVDGRITRKGMAGTKWTPGADSQLGGIEITFRRPQTVGTVVFYDDPAEPDAAMNQYIVEYWQEDDAKEEAKKGDEEAAVDEARYRDEWKGEWKPAVIERDSRSITHVHRLPQPITSYRFRISALRNRNKRESETRITEVEFYGAGWPSAGGGSRRRRWLPDGRIETLASVTPMRSHRFCFAEPAFADGLLFMSSGEDVFATRLHGLSKRWSFNVTGHREVNSSPTVLEDTILFGAGDAELRALNRKTGELAWSFPTRFPIRGSPCVLGDRVFFGTEGGRVYAVNAEDAEMVWEFRTGHPILASVAGEPGTVYFGSTNHSIYAVDAKTGKERWSFKTGGGVRCGVAVGDDAIYVGSDDGQVYALAKATGKPVWSHKTGDYVEASPAIDEHAVYIGSLDGIFRALDRKTGKVLWQLDAASPIRCPALVLGNDVFFHADNALLYQLEKATGTERSQIKLLAPGLSGITPVGANLVIGTRGGYAFVKSGPAKRQ